MLIWLNKLDHILITKSDSFSPKSPNQLNSVKKQNCQLFKIFKTELNITRYSSKDQYYLIKPNLSNNFNINPQVAHHHETENFQVKRCYNALFIKLNCQTKPHKLQQKPLIWRQQTRERKSWHTAYLNNCWILNSTVLNQRKELTISFSQ